MRRDIKQSWQIAKLETQMQITSGRTPNWYKVLRRAEISVIRWGAQDTLNRHQGYIAYAIIIAILLICTLQVG